MLRKKAFRKIIVTTFSIVTIFLLCIMPDKLSNNNYLNPKIDTIYVDNNNTNEIYLLGSNNYLVKTNVIINKESLNDKIKEIINYLTVDKSSKIPNGLTGIIPKDTKINSIDVNDKIVTLDFSKELFDIAEYLEERMIESIIYSLIDLDGIEGITIKVDGNILKKLPISKKEIPLILNRNFGINKVYEIDSISNIEKVVLYYMLPINNNNYYVPVTKYINDNREKIKIIIDNLSSNFIYESSLVSLLNSNTELINYEIEDNKMLLNFSSSIFSNNKLLEEVIYPISKSVFDNYDIDTVIFQINGKDYSIYEKCCGLKDIKEE